MQLNATKEARKVLKNSLCQGVGIDSLRRFIEDKGYKVIFYENEHKEKHILLKWLDLVEYSGKVKGFTVHAKGKRFVFIKKADEQTMLHVLAHEAGHIVMQHLQRINRLCKYLEEMEAEAFAYGILWDKEFKECGLIK